ncbi:MAG: purine-nucleoside phosphorylase [Ktedonobacteraceae bacterium]|nr:purine-nucleoside phosphorylase [Ktedonobacteraceae bacterium]
MLYNQVIEAVTTIQARCHMRPAVALILGSGLGDLAAELENATVFPYAEIPHFARSTVAGHNGRLLLGELEGVPAAVMQGRFHLYEGYSPQVLTLPVRVMAELGAKTLVVSNAAGGVNPDYRTGDFMLIRDHIFLPGLAGANPLLGPNEERWGMRFPPLARAYDAGLRQLAHRVAAKVGAGLNLHEGVYTMVAGPSFETAAELKFLRIIGTDAVGMSTVPEVVVARHMGMRVLGISLITNPATGEEQEEIQHSDVIAVAEAARPAFSALVRGIVRAGSVPQ